jgi:hypothetical protein
MYSSRECPFESKIHEIAQQVFEVFVLRDASWKYNNKLSDLLIIL